MAGKKITSWCQKLMNLQKLIQFLQMVDFNENIKKKYLSQKNHKKINKKSTQPPPCI